MNDKLKEGDFVTIGGLTAKIVKVELETVIFQFPNGDKHRVWKEGVNLIDLDFIDKERLSSGSIDGKKILDLLKKDWEESLKNGTRTCDFTMRPEELPQFPNGSAQFEQSIPPEALMSNRAYPEPEGIVLNKTYSEPPKKFNIPDLDKHKDPKDRPAPPIMDFERPYFEECTVITSEMLKHLERIAKSIDRIGSALTFVPPKPD